MTFYRHRVKMTIWPHTYVDSLKRHVLLKMYVNRMPPSLTVIGLVQLQNWIVMAWFNNVYKQMYCRPLMGGQNHQGSAAVHQPRTDCRIFIWRNRLEIQLTCNAFKRQFFIGFQMDDERRGCCSAVEPRSIQDIMIIDLNL